MLLTLDILCNIPFAATSLGSPLALIQAVNIVSSIAADPSEALFSHQEHGAQADFLKYDQKSELMFGCG